MNNSERTNFYFGIAENKIYICFLDSEKNKLKNSVNFDIPDSLNNNLNFKIILNLLQKNIRKLEKELDRFINNGNISIQSKTYQNILLSVKDVFDERELDKEVINKLVRSAIQQLYNNEKSLTILHVIINKYIVDDKQAVDVFFMLLNSFLKNSKSAAVFLEISNLKLILSTISVLKVLPK